MAYTTVFKRYELKYLITSEAAERVREAIEPYMHLDSYGRTTIRNLYFDTDNYLLIRRSIEKPIYKEKLRVRSYERATADSPVFVEIKKKYKHVVYKRRLPSTECEALEWCARGKYGGDPCQISREIDYFFELYGTLSPRVFLSYEREAFYESSGGDFRLTFDENVLARTTALSLAEPVYGTPLLDGGRVLMELKCSGGIPLWMIDILSREGIYKSSFSKYGAAYTKLIFDKFKGEIK